MVLGGYGALFTPTGSDQENFETFCQIKQKLSSPDSRENNKNWTESGHRLALTHYWASFCEVCLWGKSVFWMYIWLKAWLNNKVSQ